MRKAVEMLEGIKIVYRKTVIPNELYRDETIERVKKEKISTFFNRRSVFSIIFPQNIQH